MYTKIIYETVEEFVSCKERPDTVYVVFDGDNHVFLSGDGSEKFGLAPSISQQEIFVVGMFRALGIDLHRT